MGMRCKLCEYTQLCGHTMAFVRTGRKAGAIRRCSGLPYVLGIRTEVYLGIDVAGKRTQRKEILSWLRYGC